MLKNIYSLLVLLFLFAACTQEMEESGEQSADASKVTLSFKVDIPVASVATKATSVPAVENGIENLNLVTYDNSGNLIEVVSASSGSAADSYKATVSKETRKIQFISNYDGDLSSMSSPDLFRSKSINEYVFWAEKDFSGEPASNIGEITMLRNWSKVNLSIEENELTKNLYDPQFYIYSASTKATIAPYVANTVNVPADNGHIAPDETQLGQVQFVDAGTGIPLFENSNQGENPSFVILRGRYGSESANYSYYKIDLSVTELTGESSVYDIIRNYCYQVTVKGVTREGVSWKDIIVPGRVADYNIITSLELIKYPSISYENESLEVSKTTYIFVNTQGSSLNMNATYKLNGVVNNGSLKLGVSDEKLSDIVEGGGQAISLNGGTITAKIKGAGSDVKTAAFYVMGGKLQRKITLILRPAYEFTAFYASPDVVNEGIGSETTVHFSIPEDVDPSVYPFECRIKAEKLYAVEEGVRIETTGNGEYYYVYVIKNYQSDYTVKFKTNTAVFTETLELSADLFNNKTCQFTAVAPPETTFDGTVQYPKGKVQSSDYAIQSIPKGSTLYWKTANEEGSVSVGNNGSYKITIPAKLNDTDMITLSYTTSADQVSNGYVVYEVRASLIDLGNKTVQLKPVSIRGTIRYKYSGNKEVPAGADVKVYRQGTNTEFGSIIVDENGWYQFNLPDNYNWTDYLEVRYVRSSGKGQGTYKSGKNLLPVIGWASANNQNITLEK